MAQQLTGHNNLLEELLLSIQDGDQNALAALYRETSTSVYSFSLSILKNAYDAEDVLQECFIKIYESAKQYKPCGKTMAWILTIAKNLCFMHLRQQSRTEPLPEQLDAQLTWSEEATTIDRVVLQQCMSRLTDEQRQIVVLHAVAGMKHREIAQLLDMALPTVLSKYHRALQKLRSHI